MPPSSQTNVQVHQCIFQATIQEVNMILKFPCKLFVVWKNVFDQQIARTQNPNATIVNNIATFNETIAFKTYMIFEKSTQTYRKKQTDLVVLLSPNRKPNEQNFIGRVSISLSDLINERYLQSQKHQLQFGSAKNRFLVFSGKLLSKQIVDKKPNQIKLDTFQVVKTIEIAEKQQPKMDIGDIDKENKRQELILPPPISREKKLQEESLSKKSMNGDDYKTKLEEQNKKLFDVSSQSHEQLQQFKKENEKLKEKLKNLEREKQIIIEELINQVKQKTQENLGLKNILKQSQELRLHHESENLQLKYQLSNLKEDLISNDDKAQIQILKKEVVQLQEYIQLHKKGDQTEYLKAIRILNEEKNNLQEHLMAMERDRQRFELQKRILEARLMKAQQYDFQEIQQRLMELQVQSNKFKSSLRLSQNENSLLKEKIKDLQMKISSLHDRCLTGEKKFEQLQLQRSHFGSEKQLEINILQKFLEEKNRELEALKTDFNEVREKLKMYENEKKKHETEIKKLQNNLKSSLKQKDQEHVQKKNLNEQFSQMNKIRNQLTNKNLILENEVKGLETKLSKVENELKSKDQILKDRKVYSELLTKQIEDEIKNTQELQEKITKFAEKQMKMRENILILEEESRKIYEIVLDKEENQQNQNQLLLDREEQISHLKVELNQVKTKFDETIKENSEIKKQLYQIKKQAIVSKTPENLDPKQNKKFQQMQKLSSKRIQEVQKQKEEAIKNHNFKFQQLQKKYQQLQNEKQRLQRERIKALETQRSELKKQKNQLLQKNKWLEYNIKALESRISELELEVEKTINQNKTQLISQKEEESILRKENIRMKKQIQDYDEKLRKSFERQFEMRKTEDSPEKQLPANVNYSGIMSVYEDLKKLIEERAQKQQSQATIELLIGKISAMEEGLLNITKQRGLIQEMARNLSMQVQKIKASLIKGKIQVNEKKQLMSSLKPCDEIVKKLINLTENLSGLNVEEFD